MWTYACESFVSEYDVNVYILPFCMRTWNTITRMNALVTECILTTIISLRALTCNHILSHTTIHQFGLWLSSAIYCAFGYDYRDTVNCTNNGPVRFSSPSPSDTRPSVSSYKDITEIPYSPKMLLITLSMLES